MKFYIETKKWFKWWAVFNSKEEREFKYIPWKWMTQISYKIGFYFGDILLKEKDIIYKIDEKEYVKLITTKLKKYHFEEADNLYKKGENILTYNEYINIKKIYIKKFFIQNKKNPDEINDEKYDILADISNYLLVKARAWTGKTTTLKYKTRFINKAYGVNPDEILVCAFNKKASQEIKGKIQNMNIWGFGTSYTFHSLAWKILARKFNNEKYDLLFDDNERKDPVLSEFVQEIFREMEEKERKNREKKLYQFFRTEINELYQDQTLLSKSEYYTYIKDQTQITLSGKRVKSKYEKRIADFLFEHNIQFNYEPIYTQETKNKFTKKYRPDFQLSQFMVDQSKIQDETEKDKITNKNVFIEFWGVLDPDIANISERPKYLSENSYEEYMEQIPRKRKKMKDKWGILIELNLSEGREWRWFLEKRLKEELEKKWIICNKLDEETLIKKIKERHIDKMTKKIVTFIWKSKQNKLTVENLKEKFQNDKFWEKLTIYYEFAIAMYEKYEKRLKEHNKKDFNDLLWEATNYIHEQKGNIKIKLYDKKYQTLNNFKYILIDEYQDFSLLFWEIISWLMKYNADVKIICVGDDWQLINTFAWSNITYIQNFGTDKYFPWWNTLTLLTSNRCPKQALDISNKVMEGKWYPAQWNDKEVGEIKGYSFSDKEFEYKYTGEKRGIESLEEAMCFWNNKLEETFIIDSTNFFEIDKYNNEDLAKTIYWTLKILEETNIYYSNFDENHNSKNKDIISSFLLCRANYLHNNNEIELPEIQKKIKFIRSRHIINNDKDPVTLKKVKDNIDKIFSIQTFHKSKGLEADIVILPEIWSNKYPFLHPDNELNEIFGDTIKDILDEERRLFYVAITRTKNKLFYISEKPFPQEINYWEFLIESRWT